MAATADQLDDDAVTVGPPMAVAGTGLVALVVSILLAAAGSGVAVHLLGYLTGALVPVLVIGIARRADLDRRRDPGYRAIGLFSTALLALGVGAVLAAALHVWPLATEWAS